MIVEAGALLLYNTAGELALVEAQAIMSRSEPDPVRHQALFSHSGAGQRGSATQQPSQWSQQPPWSQQPLSSQQPSCSQQPAPWQQPFPWQQQPPQQPVWTQPQQPVTPVHGQPGGHGQQDDSPPGSIKALKRDIRGLRVAQSIPGQEPSALAARAQQIDGLECALEDRERKHRKYGSW